MAMITVRVSDEEKRMAFLHGRIFRCDVVGFVKSYSMEQLEDEYDKQTAEIAHKRWIARKRNNFYGRNIK